MTLPHPTLDEPTRALIALAAAIASGNEAAIRARSQACLAADVPPRWVDELLLQSLLMVGWPRTLVAARAWRMESGLPPEGGEDLDYSAYAAWVTRGEAACALIYGDHYEKLRENVRALHPALDAWMVAEGYGRTLGRPGLDFRRRELCVVAQTAVLDTPRQLRSHLLGALHTGATPAEVDEALTLIVAVLPAERASEIRDLWAAVRRVREQSS
jgi:alkylhydroperoxidase/carboxymuconolactone decarboxylase family protein YurZ